MTTNELKQDTVSNDAVSKEAVSNAAVSIHAVAGRITRVSMAALIAGGLSACVTEPTVNAPWGTPGQGRGGSPAMDRGGDGYPAGTSSSQGGGQPGGPTDSADVPLIAGRVSYVGGSAQIWDARDNQWRPAALNETVGPQSVVRTQTGSRLEVAIGTT